MSDPKQPLYKYLFEYCKENKSLGHKATKDILNKAVKDFLKKEISIKELSSIGEQLLYELNKPSEPYNWPGTTGNLLSDLSEFDYYSNLASKGDKGAEKYIQKLLSEIKDWIK
ncbi:hypothetical protein HYS03_02005 [Candidatus Woesebacteria bacterium]|nr:hypothetical protein [Candidatus Woesebacteria bacterium]QQG47461.1 MAG: hypothetical protein HY044_05065 [Candidatus Woesebacteria bacterium]